MKKRFYDFKNLDFSDCREITGDELYTINGGKQVENSNEGVANAQPGDTIIRDDKTEITLNQGDIDWAQAHTGSGNNTTQTIQNPVDTNHTTNPINPTGTSTGATPSVSINSFTPVPTGNYEIDNVNQIVSVDINNPQNIIDAYDSYFFLGDKGFSLQLKDGENIVHTFTDTKCVSNYIKSLEESNNEIDISETLNTVSTGCSLVSEGLNLASEYSNDAVNIAKMVRYSKSFSKASSITGFFSFCIDAKSAIRNPTFNKLSNVVNDGASLFPIAGPLYSLEVKAITDLYATTIRIGLAVDSQYIKKDMLRSYYDQKFNFGINDYTKNLIFSSFNYSLKNFFSGGN